jgi:hypothetical protein
VVERIVDIAGDFNFAKRPIGETAMCSSGRVAPEVHEIESAKIDPKTRNTYESV